MELDDVDYASLVATLEERIERKDIATAVGVDVKTIDDIASGYVPDDALATKLRALATSGKADDPGSTKVSRRMLTLFVVCDAIFFVALGVVIFVVMR